MTTRMIVAAVIVLAGCPASPPLPPAATPDAVVHEQPPVEPTEPSPPPVTLSPFSWERVLVLGNDAKLAGPGLTEDVKAGDRVALLRADGTTQVTAIDTVDREACATEPGAGCIGVWIAMPDEDDDASSGSAWTFPGRPATLDDDLALTEATLAVTGNVALPERAAHALEVRWFDALCEADETDGDFALLARATSDGPHPLAGAPALGPFRNRPQRVVTLRIAGRSFHFVSTADIRMPRSHRMSDLSRRRREAFFIFEGEGAGARLLHEETHATIHNVNHDFTCQLPLRYPIPWSVVAVDGEAFVLTRSGLVDHERWSMTATELHRAGAWTADVLELF